MASVILAWPGLVQSQSVRKPKRPQLTGYWPASLIKVKALPEIVWVKQSWGGAGRAENLLTRGCDSPKIRPLCDPQHGRDGATETERSPVDEGVRGRRA